MQNNGIEYLFVNSAGESRAKDSEQLRLREKYLLTDKLKNPHTF